jgi:hypothetical protein
MGLTTFVLLANVDQIAAYRSLSHQQHHHPTTGDKIQGTKEILEGKILRKPEPVEHGLERKTGELEEKKKQEEDSADVSSLLAICLS